MTGESISDLLAHHPFFAGTPAAMLDRIAASARVAEFAPDAFLTRSGGAADTFHAVVDGRAAVEITAPGRPTVVVATIHGGDVVGWSWFVEPNRWRFDVVALDRVCTIAIPAGDLRAACDADPAFGYRVAHRLAGVIATRLEATRHQLVDVYGSAT